MRTIRQVFEEANKAIIKALQQELADQGHHLTGGLEASIKGEITQGAGDITITGTSFAYGQILSKGTTPARIPFSPGSGAKTSKYIDALTAYFVQRGLNAKEAKSAAFATAIKQKKEGMPTAASSKYSKNGQRLNFIGIVRDATGPKIDTIILGGLDKIINDTYHLTKSERI